MLLLRCIVRLLSADLALRRRRTPDPSEGDTDTEIIIDIHKSSLLCILSVH